MNVKTFHIILLVAVICISSILYIQNVYAIPYIPPPAKYFNSDIVLIGKVISSTPFSPTDTKYEIKVEQYLKNPQSQDAITVIASGTNKTIGMTADTIFDVGQRVFLYLKQDKGNYVVWWYSHPTDFLCDPVPTAADLNSANVKDARLDYEPLHVGADKSNSYLYAPHQPIVISYDAWNNQFITKTFDVIFQVKNQTGQIMFNDTKQVELKPCIGHQIVNSTFTPRVPGMYEADVVFDNTLIGTTVQIPRPSGLEEVFLTLDKYSYMPGDLVLVRGQVFLNATNVTVSLEKNHELLVSTKDIPISKNATFYANFTIPIDDTAKSWTLVVGGTLHQDLHFKSDSIAPLEQFWSGIAPKDTLCKTNFVLVFKAEDKTPACVKPDTASILVTRGWTHDTSILPKNVSHTIIPFLNNTNFGKPETTNENQSHSPLQLFLSVDSEYENPAWPVTIDVGLNNTGSAQLTLEKSDNWPRADLQSGLCSNLPFGISILKGYYTEQNMSSAHSLVIYGLVPCPPPPIVKSYMFQPLSSMATQECDSLFSCHGLTDMRAHLAIPDFMDNGQHHSFDIGKYTIVGGDEWRHVVIQHFTEEYATAYSNPIGK